MNEDPIVAEIRRYRAEHAEHYGHDLGRICELSTLRPITPAPRLTQPQAPTQVP